MDDISKYISELATVMEELNSSSKASNDVLKSVEAQIYGANASIEVWLPERLAETVCDDDSLDEHPRFDYSGVRTCVWYEVGWARTGDRWGIAHRRATQTHAFNASLLENETFATMYDPARPILNAPRAVRLSSLPLIPQLVVALRDEAMRIRDSVAEFLPSPDAESGGER